MVNGLIQVPAMMKWRAGKPVEPIFVSVVDLNSPGSLQFTIVANKLVHFEISANNFTN